MLGVIASLIVVIVTAVSLFLRMRLIDRISLVMAVMKRLHLIKLIMMKPKGCEEAVADNGFKTMLPKAIMVTVANESLKLKMRSDDVIIATYAKAGTTWMQEIVWLICNDADFETAKKVRVVDRYGFLEAPKVPDFGKGFQDIENWPKNERRFIKTHFPFQLLPNELQRGGKGKMICVARNPKDNCVSYFHFHRMTIGLPEPGTWSEFLEKFCTGNVVSGDWFDFVHKYWEVYQKRKDEIYFVTYERLKKDLKGEVKKLAKFLEANLSEEKIAAIAHHCTFDSMSKNEKANYQDASHMGVMDFKKSKFMRKGEVGDWKNHFTINQNIAFDEMYKTRTKGWTLEFEFEPTT